MIKLSGEECVVLRVKLRSLNYRDLSNSLMEYCTGEEADNNCRLLASYVVERLRNEFIRL